MASRRFEEKKSLTLRELSVKIHSFYGAREPLVSILIPIYNGAEHLRDCLNSVLSQTFRNIEIVCVDDGSTDESPAILAEFAARDPRLVVLTQKNCGSLHARSTAARAATGEYFLCLDDDDIFRPNIVERAVSAALEKQVDVVEFSCTIRRRGLFNRRRLWQWGSPRRKIFVKFCTSLTLFLRPPAVKLAVWCGTNWFGEKSFWPAMAKFHRRYEQ
ncbi:MAG: glycosyltransferase family 2 protein [Puniceicoccales bacterium]|jgi:glycosyltransferase involved in cell wall biosynthesis|nr:glycosyltransferase family 2 protein [Puniceicoccales bacterium]